jgi:GNAT superfamily N-acetyltransferase
MDLPPEHAAFLEAERSRWAAAAAAGRLYFAVSADERIGFAALGFVDGKPYLEQMSVRRAHMRRGVGAALLARAIAWSAAYGDLWLTTYDHVAWNQRYYERFGFVTVDERDCGDELQAVLRSERRALPAPKHRTAMVFRHRMHTSS